MGWNTPGRQLDSLASQAEESVVKDQVEQGSDHRHNHQDSEALSELEAGLHFLALVPFQIEPPLEVGRLLENVAVYESVTASECLVEPLVLLGADCQGHGADFVLADVELLV